MGVVAAIPADTSVFYEDTYYGATDASEIGYVDYQFTADHSLLWVKLLVEAVRPAGRVLDVGCANGHLLQSLAGAYDRFGIEVNDKAASLAAMKNIQIVASDVFAPSLVDGVVGRFDVITSIATFEHVNDFRRAFQVCLDRLEGDGMLIFEVPLMSYTRDNKDWLNSSYEHVYYPTEKGMEALFAELNDHRFLGFESDIAGYSSTYIGVATKNPAVFSQLEALLHAMKKLTPEGLSEVETSINLAYNVVHSFNVTAERILALPYLIKRAYSFNLIKRLTQLWHADRTAADTAANATASVDWYKQQAENWQREWEHLHRDTEVLKATNAVLYKQLQDLSKLQ